MLMLFDCVNGYLGAGGYDDGDANLCKSVAGGEGRRLPPLISTTQHASGCPSLLPRHPHHTLEKATKTFILEEKRIYVVNMQIHTLLIRNSSYGKGQHGNWHL